MCVCLHFLGGRQWLSQSLGDTQVVVSPPDHAHFQGRALPPACSLWARFLCFPSPLFSADLRTVVPSSCRSSSSGRGGCREAGAGRERKSLCCCGARPSPVAFGLSQMSLPHTGVAGGWLIL